MKKSSGYLDSRKYDDVCLLARILASMDFKNEEKEVLLKHFERDNND